MRKGALILALLFCAQAFQTFQSANAFAIPSTPAGYVNDYANIIDGNVKQQLEEELRLFKASTTNEIAVVTIPSLDGDTIEHYATKLFESWKIGNAKNDNGVLLLISRDDKKIRIEVGYGLEGALPDILAQDIIKNQITPSFKQGDYSTGIVQGITGIMKATYGEYKVTKLSGTKSPLPMLETIVVIVVLGFQFLSAILARSKSWWAGGVLGGLLGGALTFIGFFGITAIVGGLLTIFLILIGLFFDYFVSSTYTTSVRRGGSIPWWIGGRGSSGGGSSFGGLGGGSSGGGGASGSW